MQVRIAFAIVGVTRHSTNQWRSRRISTLRRI